MRFVKALEGPRRNHHLIGRSLLPAALSSVRQARIAASGAPKNPKPLTPCLHRSDTPTFGRCDRSMADRPLAENRATRYDLVNCGPPVDRGVRGADDLPRPRTQERRRRSFGPPPVALDDVPDSTALTLMGAACAVLGDILFL